MGRQNKIFQTKNNKVQKTTIEVIFGEQAIKLFPFLPLLTILSSVLIKGTSLYVKLLAIAMFGIVTCSSIWIVYKAIKFKICNKNKKNR